MSEASSLHYLAQWIRDTESFAPNATRMLIGNKSDLESSGEVDENTARSFASAHKFELHYKTSCRTNEGIADAFAQLARALHKPETILSEPRTSQQENNDDLIDITSSPGAQGSSCKC